MHGHGPNGISLALFSSSSFYFFIFIFNERVHQPIYLKLNLVPK